MRLFRNWAVPAGRFQTIRYRLATAMAVALLPVLLLSALESGNGFRREIESQKKDLSLAAERSTATARARLDGAIVVLQTLAPQASGPNAELALQSVAGGLPSYDALVRFGPDGRASWANQPQPLAGEGAGPWFERLRGGEPVTISRASESLRLARPGVVVAVRVLRAGRFDGALAAVVPLADLTPTAENRDLPPGAEVAIADRTGAIINTADPAAFAGVGKSWVAKAARGSVLFSGRDAQGRKRLYAGAPLAGDDAYVLLSSPSQEVLSWALLNPMATLILPLLAWGIAVLAVVVVSERVVIRWLEYLERIASIYAKGRFSVRPVQARNAPLEIRTLAITLDQMADAIDARDASLRESLAHKDALMREIHHRVKNNLQVISSLLNMQQRSLSDPAARSAMSDTRQRITALALIYRALYQSPDLKRVDVRQFLEELIAQLVVGEAGRGPPLVRMELEADTLVIDPDKLAPLALWAVEAITSAQKHAYACRGATLRVRFKVEAQESRLSVEDDGRDADRPKDQAEDVEGAGVGRTLMTAFARQLRGHSEIGPRKDGGLFAELVFPTPEGAPQTDHEAAASKPRPGSQAAA